MSCRDAHRWNTPPDLPPLVPFLVPAGPWHRRIFISFDTQGNPITCLESLTAAGPSIHLPLASWIGRPRALLDKRHSGPQCSAQRAASSHRPCNTRLPLSSKKSTPCRMSYGVLRACQPWQWYVSGEHEGLRSAHQTLGPSSGYEGSLLSCQWSRDDSRDNPMSKLGCHTLLGKGKNRLAPGLCRTSSTFCHRAGSCRSDIESPKVEP